MSIIKPHLHNAATFLLVKVMLQQAKKDKIKQQPSTHTLSVRGHNIWYQELGDGPPILFLHGLGASSLSWLLTMPSLSATSRRTIAIDHIGHGRSEKPAIKYRVSDFVDYVEAFLEQLKIKEIDIVGNSLGGWIAARLAIRRPELVRRLVLVGSAGLQPWPELRTKLEQVKFAPRNVADTRELLSLCFYNKERFANQISAVISYFMRNLEESHNTVTSVLDAALDPQEWLDDIIDRIRAKTLILWGRQDELMPIEFANKFYSGIPGARLEIVEQCGHVPQIEHPKIFNRIIGEFLTQ